MRNDKSCQLSDTRNWVGENNSHKHSVPLRGALSAVINCLCRFQRLLYYASILSFPSIEKKRTSCFHIFQIFKTHKYSMCKKYVTLSVEVRRASISFLTPWIVAAKCSFSSVCFAMVSSGNKYLVIVLLAANNTSHLVTAKFQREKKSLSPKSRTVFSKRENSSAFCLFFSASTFCAKASKRTRITVFKMHR